MSVALACSVGWFDFETLSFEALLDLQNIPALLLLSGLIFLALTAALSVLELARVLKSE
jgi:hypothetical protein